MTTTYRALFEVLLLHTFIAKSSIEAGLQCILADVNQDNVSENDISKERSRISSLFYSAKKTDILIQGIKETSLSQKTKAG